MSVVISQARKDKLAAVARAHLEWARREQRPADDALLHVHGVNSDYGDHHLDVDLSPGAEERFHALVRQHSSSHVEKYFNPAELRDTHGRWARGITAADLTQFSDSTVMHAGDHDGYSTDRRALHHDIVSRSLAGHEPQDRPVAVFMGGGAGSGKSVLLNRMPAAHKGAVIDADAYKEQLPEYQVLRAAGSKNAAGFTYAEGSRMAQDAVTEATDRHLNFTLDGAGGSGYDSMKERTDNARRGGHYVDGQYVGGHHIHAVYVTTNTDEAIRRAEERGAVTGRYIPEPIIRAAHQSVTDTFRDAVQRGGLFDTAELWDNNGIEPSLIGELSQDGTWTVHDQPAWERFLAKGTPQVTGAQ